MTSLRGDTFGMWDHLEGEGSKCPSKTEMGKITTFLRQNGEELAREDEDAEETYKRRVMLVNVFRYLCATWRGPTGGPEETLGEEWKRKVWWFKDVDWSMFTNVVWNSTLHPERRRSVSNARSMGRFGLSCRADGHWSDPPSPKSEVFSYPIFRSMRRSPQGRITSTVANAAAAWERFQTWSHSPGTQQLVIANANTRLQEQKSAACSSANTSTSHPSPPPNLSRASPIDSSVCRPSMNPSVAAQQMPMINHRAYASMEEYFRIMDEFRFPPRCSTSPTDSQSEGRSKHGGREGSDTSSLDEQTPESSPIFGSSASRTSPANTWTYTPYHPDKAAVAASPPASATYANTASQKGTFRQAEVADRSTQSQQRHDWPYIFNRESDAQAFIAAFPSAAYRVVVDPDYVFGDSDGEESVGSGDVDCDEDDDIHPDNAESYIAYRHDATTTNHEAWRGTAVLTTSTSANNALEHTFEASSVSQEDEHREKETKEGEEEDFVANYKAYLVGFPGLLSG